MQRRPTSPLCPALPLRSGAVAVLLLLVAALAAGAASPRAGGPAASSTAPGPNVVVVIADQFRGMEMGCAGNAAIRTPNLDRLAREGVRFTHAYANVPVCVPSRACMLTGRFPLSHRTVANDLPLPESEVTLAEQLRDAGYRTGYIGKWHLDGVPRTKFTPPGPRRQGFDDFWAVWNCAHSYLDFQFFRDVPTPVHMTGYEPVAQTDLALEFMAQKDARPFCLFLAWGPPHDPYYQVPEQYRRMYDPGRLPLRPNVSDKLGANPALGPIDRANGMRRNFADYYAAITALDEQMGRLLLSLEQSGQAKNTLVVFTSDHGDMLFSHGRLKKQQPYEEAANVPLLMRWTGRLPAGRVAETMVGTVDLAPTLLSLVGQKVPGRMEGQNLAHAALGLPGKERKSVFLMDMVPTDEGRQMGQLEWRGVRTARYTYARWIDGKDWLLFDNQRDPYQQRNLIGDPDVGDVRKELATELDGWMRRTRDAGLPWDQILRKLRLTELWNARERELHPKDPRLVNAN